MIENFQDLLDQLQSKMNEYIQNGEHSKASKIRELGQYLYSNCAKINPTVRNSPEVLKRLCLEIERGVYAFKTDEDKFKLTIQQDGSLEIRREDEAYIRSIDGRKAKDTSIITFNQLFPKNPKYVSITTSQAHTIDGVSQDASDYDKHHFKSEADITYTKEVFNSEGLQIQGTTAHTILKDNMNTLHQLSMDYIIFNMSMHEPNYSVIGGYSPKYNSGIHYDKIVCSTRGTDFGDEQNIGMYHLLQETQKGGCSLTDCTSSFEPVIFSARGQYLDYEHKADGVLLTPTPEKTYDELKKEAIAKFGGEKGWDALLEASKYRSIPQILKKHALNKIQSRNNPQSSQYSVNEASFKSIAGTQRAGNVSSQTTYIKKDLQRDSNQYKDMNGRHQ